MPYPNNYNLFNPQQQYANYFTPSMQQQMQMQNMPMPNMQNNLSTGKMVDSIETVKVADIPMDGNAYYFPKADGSEVYSKKWLANGSTEISVYQKVIAKEETKETEEKETFDFGSMQNNLIDRLDSISERIGKLEKGLVAKAPARSTKE